MSETSAAAVGAMTRARRRMIAHFRDAGATTPDAAIRYVAERGIEVRLIEELTGQGILNMTAPDTYWIDLTRTSVWGRNRWLRTGAAVGAAAAIGAAIGLLAGRA